MLPDWQALWRHWRSCCCCCLLEKADWLVGAGAGLPAAAAAAIQTKLSSPLILSGSPLYSTCINISTFWSVFLACVSVCLCPQLYCCCCYWWWTRVAQQGAAVAAAAIGNLNLSQTVRQSSVDCRQGWWAVLSHSVCCNNSISFWTRANSFGKTFTHFVFIIFLILHLWFTSILVSLFSAHWFIENRNSSFSFFFSS